jgi:branched-chain amino acid transport system substrate-binding protein
MKTFAAGFAGLLFFLIAHAGTVRAEEVVKVAFFAPLSGPSALAFEEWLRIFRAAAEAANAREGTKSGKRIEIVPFDNKGNVQDTLIVFQQARDQNIAYVAATISSVANALSEAVLKHNMRNPDKPVLFLDYDARDPALTEERCNFWHFRFEPHTDMQIRVLVSAIARQASVKKIYLLNQDYAWGHSVQKSARDALKEKRPDIEIVGDDLVPLQKVKDFAPYIAKIKASGADSVLTGNWGQDLALFVKAAHANGLNASLFTTHAWGLGTPSAMGASGENRVQVMNAWFVNAGPLEWERKVLQSEKQYKASSHMDFLPIWQTVDMFARALALAGTSDPIKVAYALEGMEYETPGGRSWMRKDDHQLIAPIYIASFTKAGTAGVKYDEEGTGYGWKIEWVAPAKDNVPAMRCQMERPKQ